MATVKDNKVQLKLVLNNGQNKKGKTQFKTLTYKDLSKDISNEHLLELGNKIAGLQTLHLEEVCKVQRESVVE